VAYLGGKLFVTSGFRFVAALDASTGKLLWRQNVDAPIHGAPVVADGRVIAINIDDELQTFNADTGVPDWTYQGLTEPARILKASSPAVAGDTVVAAFASGELVALRTSNGNESWTQVLSRASRTNALSEIRDIAGRPVVYRGDVLAGSHSGVFMAVDLRSGQPRWTLPVTTISTPWPAGDVVFIVSKAGEVICASRENGQVYWITELNKGLKRKKRALYTGPVLASGRLIVVSNQGDARALDPKTGAVQSSIKLSKEGSEISPMAMNGTLYVVTDDAKLVAIR
jgi:outer membrane protein assembly factor BamB